jgi:DNA-binding NarL/FixJ family response regulator
VTLASLPTHTSVVPLTVVLIEDHQALREGLELLLSREGLDVIGTAGSAGEGRKLIDRTGPDVALIDIRLGDESGIDLTRALLDADRDRRPRLRAEGGHAERADRGAEHGRRGRHLRGPAP